MNKLKRGLIFAFLTGTAFLSIFPFLWMIIGATNKSVDVTRGALMPGDQLIVNMRNLFENTEIQRAFLNSTIIAVSTTLLAILVSSLAGYAFVVYANKYRDRLFKTLLLSMMVPFSAIMIPLFRMFGRMGLLNTYTAVILPTVATAFLIFFFRQNAMMFSREIVEAARVDGLSEIGIFFKMFMPIMKSTYAAAAIITFMASWNSYLWPLIVMQTTDKITLPLIISNLGSSYTPDYGVIMCGIIISTLPSALIFFSMQRYFVEGMVGSVK